MINVCKAGSMKLRPEWPWRARRYKIAPDESIQYWYLFLLPPPPAMLLFHLSSDQWWQCRKCFWRSSSILQNSIAPSFSLGNLAWRRRAPHPFWCCAQFRNPQSTLPWEKTRSPWSCMLEFAMSAQFSLAATSSPGSQLLDGDTSKPRHETCTSNLTKLSHHPWHLSSWKTLTSESHWHRTSSWPHAQRHDWWEFPSELETAVSAFPDSVGTFVAGSPTADWLELPTHLCHLFSRHTEQSTRLESHSRRDHNRTATKTNTAARHQYWINISVNWCPARLCCFGWTLACGWRSVQVQISKSQITLKISAHACLRCSKCMKLYNQASTTIPFSKFSKSWRSSSRPQNRYWKHLVVLQFFRVAAVWSSHLRSLQVPSLFSAILALAWRTKSMMISATLPSSANVHHYLSILDCPGSLVLRSPPQHINFFTVSLELFFQSVPSSVELPLTYSYVKGLFLFFFSHVAKCTWKQRACSMLVRKLCPMPWWRRTLSQQIVNLLRGVYVCQLNVRIHINFQESISINVMQTRNMTHVYGCVHWSFSWSPLQCPRTNSKEQDRWILVR